MTTSLEFFLSQSVGLAQPVLTARARLGEGPVWDGARQKLYWVDIYNHRVHCFDPASGKDQYWDVNGLVSAVALMPEQRLLIAFGNRLAALDTTTGALETLATIGFSGLGTRFNDGKCDPQGRFWIGSLSAEVGQAALYRYDPDGSIHLMESGLTISNGLGWSPDGQTFYLTDSPQRTIYAYRFDGKTGDICDRISLIQFEDETIEPDGLAIDSQGNLWIALWDGGSLACFNAAGTALGRLPLPVQRPTCPTFGGPNLKTLYLTSASVGLSQAEIEQGFLAGDVFAISMPVAGLATHHFGSGLSSESS